MTGVLVILFAFVVAVECSYASFLAGVYFGRGKRFKSRSSAVFSCRSVWKSGWKFPFFWLERQCPPWNGPYGFRGDHRDPKSANTTQSYSQYMKREWESDVFRNSTGNDRLQID